jgi:hypothetical protein
VTTSNAAPNARWKIEAAALLGYLALALWWTWPLALNFSTRIAGGHGALAIGDNLQFAWNFDHVPRAWANGHSALETDQLFYPHRAALFLHTAQWHHSTLAWLLRSVFPNASLAFVCNALLIGTLMLNASAVRLLCRHVLSRAAIPNEAAAWIIGAGAALGPISQARSFGHWNLLAWGYLALLALALLKLDEVLGAPESGPRHVQVLARGKWALACAACVALAGWCDIQYVFFAALWAAAFWGWSPRALRWKRAAWWSAAFAGGALLLSPLIVGILGASRGAPAMQIAPRWSLDALDLLSPSPWHPLLGARAFWDVDIAGIEWIVAPGVTLLLLGIYGWRKVGKAARPWGASAIALWILACGPHLQIAHQPVPALGAATPSTSIAQNENLEHAVRAPFWWLRRAVGPLKSFRVPARLAIPALVCWSVCASLGLASLANKRTTRGASTCLGLGAALILFECWRAPLPSFDARPPAWIAKLGDNSAAPGGVVPLPIAPNNWRLSWAMWAQTHHRRPLWNGYLSRAPQFNATADPVRGTILWQSLQAHPRDDGPNAPLVLAGAPASPAQAAHDLESWRRAGARFLIWHRPVARRADEEKVRALLQQSGAARLIHEDAQVLVWEAAPAKSGGAGSGQVLAPRVRGTLQSAP